MIALPDGSYRCYAVHESARGQTFPNDDLFSGSCTKTKGLTNVGYWL